MKRAIFKSLIFTGVIFLFCIPLFGQEKDKEVSAIGIAFGSCSKQDLPQILWDDVLEERPDCWIWLGDNIYGDTDDMTELKAKYDKQKSHPLYQELLKSVKIYGIWDDHDYGVNDGGKGYGPKAESKLLMLDFLDVPLDNPVREREGVYQDYVLTQGDLKIKLLLLDSRYFRDDLEKVGNRYVFNEAGSILGEEQWSWLERQLDTAVADVVLIANGIQFLSSEHRFEKWANFPKERDRLLQLVSSIKSSKVVLLSGDRHLSEVSSIRLEGRREPIYEITSSGLTHSYTGVNQEANRYRLGEVVKEKSFGFLEVKKDESGIVTMRCKLLGDGGEVYGDIDLFFGSDIGR